MKIALIKCAESLNIGNAFINAGGEYVVRQMYPDAGIYHFEYYDSCITDSWKYPSPFLTASSEAFINACDALFVFGGSILHPRAEPFLHYVGTLKTPHKVLLGCGAYFYTPTEQAIARAIAPHFDLIFTRDDVTLSYFDNAAHVLPGIDLAFFADEARLVPREVGGYAVVNIDPPLANRRLIRKRVSELKEKYPAVYVVQNSTEPVRTLPDYLYLSCWQSFYNLFANAAYVKTTRIHTAVACATNGVPFKYKGGDAGGKSGRNTLFNRVGLQLERGRAFTREQLAPVQAMIRHRRDEMQDLLHQALLTGKSLLLPLGASALPL